MKCDKRLMAIFVAASLFTNTGFTIAQEQTQLADEYAKAAKKCFLIDLGCMFPHVEKIDDETLCRDYRFKQTPHHSPAYAPQWGYTFVHPEHPSQIVLAFRLEQTAHDFLNSNERFTIDIDMVTHSYLAKVNGLSQIRHNLPTNAQATNDTYFSDQLSKPTNTLFIGAPQALLAQKTYYVIFDFYLPIANFTHSFNWQLGYDTNIFSSDGMAEHIDWMTANEHDPFSAKKKAAMILGYAIWQKRDCIVNNTLEACESFALDTDQYVKFSANSFIGWKNNRISKNLFSTNNSPSKQALLEKLQQVLWQAAETQTVEVVNATAPNI